MALALDCFSSAGPGGLGGALGEQPPQGLVELQRTDAALAAGLPAFVRMGGGLPTVITMGKHEDHPVVLPLEGSSNVQCQLALRSFCLPQQEAVHQALFLRDVSSRGTLVNGVFAFRPWHWLQEGDVIGIHAADAGHNQVSIYRVHYNDLRRIPAAMVDVEEHGPYRAAPGGQNDRAPTAAEAPGAAGKGRGRGACRGGAGTQKRKGRRRRHFGPEACGKVIDLRYQEWPTPYRVKVVSFDKDVGHHHIHSRGLSTWDDESFEDEIDLNAMYARGDVSFVEGSPESSSEGSEQAKPAKRGRGRKRG